MSRRPFVMDFVPHDPPEYRDGIVLELLAAGARAKEAARRREVDEMIAMGWGGVDGNRIPLNWREVRGPESEERRAAYRDARKGHGWGAGTSPSREVQRGGKREVLPIQMPIQNPPSSTAKRGKRARVATETEGLRG